MRELHGQTRGIGWYSINPMLKEGIPVRAESFEPTGYSGQDFDRLEQAMRQIQDKHLLAVVRYVMPWRARAMDEEWGFSTDSWLRYLKAGLIDLDEKMILVDKRNTCGYLVKSM
jgi:hypothetical protein